jgi:hypothetical protein
MSRSTTYFLFFTAGSVRRMSFLFVTGEVEENTGAGNELSWLVLGDMEPVESDCREEEGPDVEGTAGKVLGSVEAGLLEYERLCWSSGARIGPLSGPGTVGLNG